MLCYVMLSLFKVVGKLCNSGHFRDRHYSFGVAVFLLQVVMVSPGTHLVKNHESLSITNECQYKKTRISKLKMLGPLCEPTRKLFSTVN